MNWDSFFYLESLSLSFSMIQEFGSISVAVKLQFRLETLNGTSALTPARLILSNRNWLERFNLRPYYITVATIFVKSLKANLEK